jgi:transcriptional regulator with XRE-family HTH domain
MAVPKQTGLRVTSRGYDLRSDRDKKTGERVSLDRVAEETGLSKMTVRRFVADKNADVSGSPLLAAAVIAEYFGVGLGDLLTVKKEEDE